MKSKLARPLASLSFAVVASLAMLPAALTLVPTDANAQIITNADRCREDLADGSRRYLERVMKARLQCETRVINGSLAPSTNCLTGRGDTVTDKRLRRAEDQLSNVGQDCLGVNLATLGFPGSCPDLSGGTFDVNDFQTCVVNTTNTIVTTLMDYYYPPIHGFFLGSEAKCLNGSARDSMRSLIGTIHAREDCLLGQEFGIVAAAVKCRNEIPPYGSGTGNAEIDSDISSAYIRLLGAIPSACADVQIDDLNYQSSCIDPTGGIFTIFDLKKCFFNVNRLQGLLAIGVPFPTGPVCGDSIVNGSEQCDLGEGNNSNTKPNTCRTNCTNPRCGDGVTDPNFGGEQCDDGNSVDTDSCTNLCKIPSGAECGDGHVDTGEECDDGETLNSDTVPNACRTNCKDAHCQDGVEDANEECDDGNSSACDSCSPICLDQFCGDNIKQACLNNEECDDGVDNSDTNPDACRTDCKLPTCGDGVTDVTTNGEDCDDGNTNNADACPNTCAFCGNNDKAQTEECDGTDIGACGPGEGCSDECECLPGACPTKGELVLYSGVGEDCSTNTDCPVGVCDQTLGRCKTATRLDSGWIGSAHDADINNEVHVTGLLECPGHGPVCGQCAVTNVDSSTGNCRCSSLGPLNTPNLGNQQICTNAFMEDDPACKKCENAGQQTPYACLVDGDCVDTAPKCSRTVKVCTNDQTKVCTSDSICGTGGTCPAKVCSNNHLTSCNANADCTAATAKCQSLKCSNDNTKVCATNTDCSVGVCNANTRKQCSTQGTANFCTADTECYIRGTCSGTADCACYFGAPFPLSSGGTPACVANRFADPISGTANVDLGSGSITAHLRTVVFLGQSGKVNPCPTCGGVCTNDATKLCDRDLDCGAGTCTVDPTPNDGLRGGRCTAGQNVRQPCDVTARNTTFPAFLEGPSGGGYSLDCFPSAGKNISGSGLVINLTQTTGTSTLTAQVPCDGGASPNDCPCLVCDGDPDAGIPCNSDAECAALGLGNCASSGTGNFPEPNGCDNYACTANPDGTGECTTGPTEFYCDEVVRANGAGIVPCNPAATPPGECGDPIDPPNYYGQCTLTQRRLCLPDPIHATGQPSPTTPIGAATFCIPPTPNTGINLAAGLPGPGRVVNQATAKTFCGPNADKEYIPGVGGCLD